MKYAKQLFSQLLTFQWCWSAREVLVSCEGGRRCSGRSRRWPRCMEDSSRTKVCSHHLGHHCLLLCSLSLDYLRLFDKISLTYSLTGTIINFQVSKSFNFWPCYSSGLTQNKGPILKETGWVKNSLISNFESMPCQHRGVYDKFETSKNLKNMMCIIIKK